MTTTDHAPATSAARHRKALVAACALTGTFMVIEAVVGLLTKSLALLADAGHMLTDVGGLVLALVAVRWAGKPPSATKTYGYYRVEILAAVGNAVALLVISIFILWEAYGRFVSPPEVIGAPMVVVGIIGLAVNLVSVWLLRAGASESLNLKGAYLEVLSDALSSVGVIVAAVIVLTTGWTRADAIIGAAIGLFIIPRTWRLLSQGVNVLLEGVPAHLDLAEIERVIRAMPGVRDVHDLHVWTLTSGREAMSGHLVVDGGAVDGNTLLRDVHGALHQQFGIDHTTIQLESQSLVQLKVANQRAGPHVQPPDT